ncbi:MAG: hypothetical protein WDZ89_01825 [Gemmatimonadota bacterium]
MSGRSGGIAAKLAEVRRYIGRRALLATVLWMGAAAGSLLILAWLLAGPDGWSQGSRIPLLLDVGVVAIVAAAVGFLFRTRRRWLREGTVGASMESAAGLAAGSVVGTLELARAVPAGASVSLARAGERAVVRRLEERGGSPRALSGAMGARSDHWIRMGGRTLAVVVPLVALAGWLAPQRAWVAWSGLAVPFHLLAAPTFPALVLQPGDVAVERGAPLDVAVEAAGRAEVTLHWQIAGDVPRSHPSAVEGGRADFSFGSVGAPLQYWATAPDGARTARYIVTPVDPLFLSDLTVELAFPPHTNRFPEEYRGEPPPLAVPAGTRVRIEGRASRALQVAELVPEGDAEVEPTGGVALVVDEARFSGDWVPARSGIYRWGFRDLDGVEPEGGPGPLDLTVVADGLPQIRFEFPGRDTVLPLSLRQPLVIEAGDDYGVTEIELVAYRVTSSGEEQEPVVDRIDVGGARGVVVRPTLNLAGWTLRPGDEVHYLARAADNAPRAQRSETEIFVLRMPESRELREDARDRLDEASERVESLAERAATAAEETRTMERQSATRPEPSRTTQGQQRQDPRASRMGFEEREDIRRSLDDQSAMVDEVDSLRNDMGNLADILEESGVTDPQLRRDLQELQELLGEIAPPELRERLQELTQALDEMDARQSSEALRELSEEQERFRERLEESLERFRRAAVDQEMRAVTAESEEIAEEEKALAEALREGGDAEERAGEQAALEERARGVEERLERLGERAAAIGEEEAGEAARSAGERSQEARRAMSEAAREAAAGNPKEAGERADEAAEAMEGVAEELQRMQEEMAERQRQELGDVLDRAVTDALSMARRQSELRGRMRAAQGEAMNDLRADEAALLQGVRSMADNLGSVAGVSRQIAGDMARALGEAMRAVEGTVEALDNRPIASTSPTAVSEQAVEALNDVALAAMQAMEQLESGEEGGSDADQLLEELGEFARQQGELAEETGSLIPMELGAEALSEQMQRMAQGQEAIAGGLDELSQRPGSEEQSLGDLEAMAREAEALARELEGGRLDPELLERQEQLFRRLLDAGRSLEREELSDEREAETAGTFEVREVEGLSTEALQALRFALPGAAELQRLSPAQRQLVLEYFERLNRDPAARVPRPEAPPREPDPGGAGEDR